MEKVEKHLISIVNKRMASRYAEKLGLKRGEYIHIPLDGVREEKLMGRRVSDEKLLIGYFTDEEKAYLLM